MSEDHADYVRKAEQKHEARWREVLNALARPFDPAVIYFKPQATTKDGNRCLAVAYADPRAYIDRLNEVIGSRWEDCYEVHNMGDRVFVTCNLNILGVERSDVGENDLNDNNAFTSAVAQAFKRACVKFNLGRYLYDLPQTWVDYDSGKKEITDKGMVVLRNMLIEVTGEKEPLSPELAAKMTTRKGSEFGKLTAVELQLIVNNAHKPDIGRARAEGAQVLLDFLADASGATDPDATYNSIIENQD